MAELTTVAFYLVPIVLFGPLLFFVLWQLGLKDVIRPSEALKASRQAARQAAKDAASGEARKQAKVHFTKHRREEGRSPVRLILQAVCYVGFAALIGYLSARPTYTWLGPDLAEIKLSLSHPGQHVAPCVKRTREELMALPPNMRAPQKCSRERVPVTLQMELDGDLLFDRTRKPEGLSGDGASTFYARLRVPAGDHRLVLRLRDNRTGEGFDAVKDVALTLEPAQLLAITYRTDQGFVLR